MLAKITRLFIYIENAAQKIPLEKLFVHVLLFDILLPL